MHDFYSQLCFLDPLFNSAAYWHICNFEASHQFQLYNCLLCPVFISCCWLLSLCLFLLLSSLPPFDCLCLCLSLLWILQARSWKGLVPTSWEWECTPCLCCSGALQSSGKSQAALHLPIFLFIIEGHLSVDKTLLWDGSNHRKYTMEGAKPRWSVWPLLFTKILVREQRQGQALAKRFGACWQ